MHVPYSSSHDFFFLPCYACRLTQHLRLLLNLEGFFSQGEKEISELIRIIHFWGDESAGGEFFYWLSFNLKTSTCLRLSACCMQVSDVQSHRDHGWHGAA